ncbi:MAG: hypothetical protein HY210_08080 [Candidatus Omnitrophica bacterium]|nr:hypothetical protein [Candidatus Omnitrophota bacterium]
MSSLKKRRTGIVLSVISLLVIAYYIKSDVPRRERADRRGVKCWIPAFVL